IDHQVRRRQILSKVVVITVVRIKFLVGQVEAGKKFVFFNDVIRNHYLLRAPCQVEAMQLLDPPHQKSELRLKRRTPLPLIKCAEKRIGLRLHHPLRIQPLRQDPGQRALAHSDRAFHCNVTGQLEKIRHSLAIFRNWQDISDIAEWQLRDELTEEPLHPSAVKFNSCSDSRLRLPAERSSPAPFTSLPFTI